MNDHELFAAARVGRGGLLDADGERRFATRQACAECRAELRRSPRSRERSAAPAPPPPPDLYGGRRALAAEADRRKASGWLGCRGGRAVLLLAVAAVAHIYGIRVFAWLGLSFIPSALGGAAALTLASRRQLERSSQ